MGRVPGDTAYDICACRPTICQWPAACHTTLHSYGAPETCSMESTLGPPFCHRNTCRLKEQSVIMFYTPDTSILHPWEFLIQEITLLMYIRMHVCTIHIVQLGQIYENSNINIEAFYYEKFSDNKCIKTLKHGPKIL